MSEEDLPGVNGTAINWGTWELSNGAQPTHETRDGESPELELVAKLPVNMSK